MSKHTLEVSSHKIESGSVSDAEIGSGRDAKIIEDIALNIEELSAGYDGKVVLSGLNFAVRKNDHIGIVGENGSGKSTLVKTLIGECAPISGNVTFVGKNGIAKNEIGYLSQTMIQKNDFPASVAEIVLSGNLGKMGLRPFYSHKEKATTDMNIERLGLGALKNRCFRELSGGQQRRVLLARSLCASGKLLILDEPASGLDPIVTAEMYEVLQKINREFNITLIVVSHDMEYAKKCAKKVLHLKNGKQEYFGEASAWRGM
ncbi:MAG: metal ABC transporter ATP-binding protein [Treponemataceae bacterium]|nr:MAG: metal ABC transporter ATP-binding protein [Treponemataceae bacterium]